MNNGDAYKLLTDDENVSDAAREYLAIFKMDGSHFSELKTKLSRLKLTRAIYVKNQNLDKWNSQSFQQAETQEKKFPKKRKSLSTED